MIQDEARRLMLARVRAGAARAAAAVVASGESPGEPWRPGAPEAVARLLRSFTEAATAVGASVRTVEGTEQARQAVDDILEAEGATRVVVSPGAAADPWHCGRGSRLTGVQFATRSLDARSDAARVTEADCGVTTASFGLANTGTLVVLSSFEEPRLDSVAPPVHVALLPTSRLLPDVGSLLERLSAERRFEGHSAVTLITGPSRTADIELTLTIGVHGPGRLHIVVVRGS